MKVGSVAPQFVLKNEKGTSISLSELIILGNTMLVFYPGDFTMVCTKQLCAYQDKMERFREMGVQIVGISRNTAEEHLAFKERYGFTFTLLTDPDRKVTKAYQVISLIMLGGTSRAVFLVSKTGIILYRYVEPTIITHRRPGELLKNIEEIKKRGQL